MTLKLIAIGVLAAVMLIVLYLNHRAARRRPRVGRPSRQVSDSTGAATTDDSAMINAALIAALASGAAPPRHAGDHGSPSSHSHEASHHGGFDGGSHGGGFDGGGFDGGGAN